MLNPIPNDPSLSSNAANPQQKNPFMFTNMGENDPDINNNKNHGFKRGGKIKPAAKAKRKVIAKKMAIKKVAVKKIKSKVKAKKR